MVDDDAVVLLGHRPVVRPQPGLHVHERQPGDVGREGAGQRGVRVALDDHGRERSTLRLGVDEQGLEADGGVGDLAAAAASADGEPVVGRRKADPALEGGGHLGVVVLAGVDQAGVGAEQGGDPAQLHGLGPGAVDDGDPRPPVLVRPTPVLVSHADSFRSGPGAEPSDSSFAFRPSSAASARR